MQHRRARAGELIGADAVAAEAQHLARDAVRLIHPADLVVRRVFERKHALAPQKLHDESVEVFRARADHDLSRLDADAARAGEIRRNGAAQLGAAVVRRLDENTLAVLAEYTPHRLGERRERKFILRPVRNGRAALGLRLGDREAVRRGEAHEKAAALAGFQIPLVAQDRQRVLDRDDTHACLCCDQALAGHLRPQRVNTADDVAPQLVIEL